MSFNEGDEIRVVMHDDNVEEDQFLHGLTGHIVEVDPLHPFPYIVRLDDETALEYVGGTGFFTEDELELVELV